MNRRRMLSLIAGAVALPGIARAMPVMSPIRQRLRLFNAHTGERFDGAFRNDEGPLSEAMAELSVFLRDFHCGAKIEIDVGVLDFLAAVMDAVGVTEATIFSAYRTRATNELLARTTFGVAENSQHIFGRALDVHFGSKLGEAMQAARAMQRGGVGWYPHSGFMHIDTGPVRNWDLDGSDFGTLLPNARSVRLADTRRSASGFRSGHFSPEIEQSGRPLPRLEQSGHLLPEMARGRSLR